MVFLKWSEMAWWLVDTEKLSPEYFGEAGNQSYAMALQVYALRDGSEILVANRECNAPIISASLTVKGFGHDKDGKTLAEIMQEDVVYNYALQPVV